MEHKKNDVKLPGKEILKTVVSTAAGSALLRIKKAGLKTAPPLVTDAAVTVYVTFC
jgi:hypothetical protein